MKKTKSGKKSPIEFDSKTKELLNRSEQIIIRSRMMIELSEMQSKRLARLFEQSEAVRNNQIK